MSEALPQLSPFPLINPKCTDPKCTEPYYTKPYWRNEEALPH